jgi:acetyl esterase/lipase
VSPGSWRHAASLSRRCGVASLLLLLSAAQAGAQEPLELKLWPDGAPGSEDWSVPESITGAATGNRVVSNVSDPTLTVYLPDRAAANGTAVVIAPGGALRALAWDSEGVRVAEWLNAKGIAGFVLKYRTMQQGGGAGGGPASGLRAGGAGRAAGAGRPGGPGGAGQRQEIEIVNGNANPAPDNDELTEVLEFAVADAQAALRLIRRNAAEWNVNPERVGIMGFSAGGGVAVGTALADDGPAYPDFLVSLYGPSLQDVVVPEHAPPLFIAVGATHFNVTSGVIALFDVWREAGKPAEMHIYDGVSAGFGMNARGLPVDTWTDRFHDWLVARGLTTP